ncbi:helix-turn-helix transcriptional regulator [Cellulomonas sp. NPDC055163]
MSTTVAEQQPDTVRRAELGSFLRRCRERLSPADVGFPSGGRRRTPGLRREEVAVLAQVGVSWYTWLEQGRDIGVSDGVLDAVARALQLDDGETAHLYRLAGKCPPARPVRAPDDVERIQRMIDGFLPRPAYVVDRYWDVVALNGAARRVFGIEVGGNCLVQFFTDEATARRYPHRELAERMMVARYRSHAATYPDDPHFAGVADDLAARSPRFRALWDEHVVGGEVHVDTVYDHDDLGRLAFEPVTMQVVGGSDLRAILHLPAAGTGTEAALARLG